MVVEFDLDRLTVLQDGCVGLTLQSQNLDCFQELLGVIDELGEGLGV